VITIKLQIFLMPKKLLKLGIAIALLFALTTLVYQFTPVKQLFDHTFLVTHLPHLGLWAPGLFILGCAISSILPLPGNFLVIAGGAVFGLIESTLSATLGVTLGAVVAFLISRSLLHRRAEQHFGDHQLLQKLETAIARSPLNLVIAARVAPVAPLSLLNVLFGLTAIRLTTYTLGTCLGILPSRALYAWVGVSGKQALTGGDRGPLFLALTLMTLLSIAPLLWQRQHKPNS
jgi:uncharacterized membrane protein YdjX (TVP38/TMEM64 family)